MKPWKYVLVACAVCLIGGVTLLPVVAGRQSAAPGGVAVAFLRPIRKDSEAVLIGGVRSGRWVEEGSAVRYLKPGKRLTLFGVNGGTKGTVTLGKSRQTNFGEYAWDIASGPNENAEYLGATAPARPHTRAVEPISAKSPHYATYSATVRDFLKTRGLSVPTPKLERVLRTDLNGDGEPEVLILANSRSPEATEQYTDFYALALLRHVKKGGGVGVLPLVAEAKKRIGEDEIYRVELCALADLDGNGKSEVVLRGFAYESAEYNAYTFDGTKTARAFGFGWGP